MERTPGRQCQLPVQQLFCRWSARRAGIGGRGLGRMAFILFVCVEAILVDARNVRNIIDVEGGHLSAEVCQMSTFEASCSTDEVVIIRTARLGRLRLGRCVKEERFDIGCSLDVLPEMDHLCSGRQKCEVKVDDSSFKRTTPCSVDLKIHLWTSYDCIKVTLPADGCSALRHPSGILSSHVTEVTGCGVADLPWVIEVGLGQRINVTLYDFEFGVALPGSEEDRSGYAKSCRVYAIIRDTGERPGQTRTVCGGMERAVNAFVSSSQKIEIRILTKSNVKPSPQNPGPHFLLHYSAIGCAEPVLSKDMWLKPTSPDTLIIGCKHVNSIQWSLTCKGNEWMGSYGNCTADKRTSAALGVPYAASTMIIVMIAIGVSSVILLIGVLCIKRKMNQEREIRRLQTEAVDHYACDGDYSLGALSPDKLTVDAANTSVVIADVPGNDYARMRLQRMTDYYAGSPPYGFDSQSYGPGYKYPVVEHVYESPDSLRREDAPPGVPVPHYMPRLHEQYGPTAGQTEGSRPIAEGSPQVAHLVQGASYRAASGAPSKTKNAGNYSL